MEQQLRDLLTNPNLNDSISLSFKENDAEFLITFYGFSRYGLVEHNISLDKSDLLLSISKHIEDLTEYKPERVKNPKMTAKEKVYFTNKMTETLTTLYDSLCFKLK